MNKPNRKYILWKMTHSYYGGTGRNDLEFDSVVEAAKGAVADGNPVGFDIYIKSEPVSQDNACYAHICNWKDAQFLANSENAKTNWI